MVSAGEFRKGMTVEIDGVIAVLNAEFLAAGGNILHQLQRPFLRRHHGGNGAENISVGRFGAADCERGCGRACQAAFGAGGEIAAVRLLYEVAPGMGVYCGVGRGQ